MVYTINGVPYDSDYLAHYGIKGMKWGVRRYQNYDGSYTQAGMKRYGVGDKIQKAGKYAKASAKMAGHMYDYALTKTPLKKSTLGKIHNYKGNAKQVNPLRTYRTVFNSIIERPLATYLKITGLTMGLNIPAAVLSGGNPVVIAGAAKATAILGNVMWSKAALDTIEDYAKLGKDYIAAAEERRSESKR